jgi:hypothetical protein
MRDSELDYYTEAQQAMTQTTDERIAQIEMLDKTRQGCDPAVDSQLYYAAADSIADLAVVLIHDLKAERDSWMLDYDSAMTEIGEIIKVARDNPDGLIKFLRMNFPAEFAALPPPPQEEVS